MEKGAAAHAPRVLIFHSCANFCCFFSRVLLQVFGLFCEILAIFANFAWFWAFFAHILCANFSVSKLCVCYFVSFFYLCLASMLTPLLLCLLPGFYVFSLTSTSAPCLLLLLPEFFICSLASLLQLTRKKWKIIATSSVRKG